MKKKFAMLLCTAMVIGAAHTQVFANNYTFGETYGAGAFGTPTTSSVPADYSAIENVRKNKDMAYYPPSYGVFSGNIPMDSTSRFHEEEANKSSVTQIPEFSGISEISFAGETSYSGDCVSSILVSGLLDGNGSSDGSSGNSSGFTVHYEDIHTGYSRITTVTPYNDDSIGSIQIPRFGVNVKVFEGTDTATMRKGVAHFEYTSQWEGNVRFASRNRGQYDYFSDLKNINIGDTIKYTTNEGIKIYKVTLKEKISNNDFTYLESTSENMVTLITCVENKPDQRWCVQATEVI